MQPDISYVIFLAKNGRFQHKHMVLDRAQFESLPHVQSHFATLLKHSSPVTIGTTTMHYLQRLIVNDCNLQLPWSEASNIWQLFAEWGHEMLDEGAHTENYLHLNVDESAGTPYDIFTGLFEAAWDLSCALKKQGKAVSHIIVVDEIRHFVPENMLERFEMVQ